MYTIVMAIGNTHITQSQPEESSDSETAAESSL